MTRLKLTSPGMLLILAIVMAGGIVLLDTFYLRPHVEAQKNATLHEQAVRIVQTSQQAVGRELDVLGTASAGFAKTREIRRFLAAKTQDLQFRTFARQTFGGTGITGAWLTAPSGRVLGAWSDAHADSAQPESELAVARQTIRKAGYPQHEVDRGLVRLSESVMLFACQQVFRDPNSTESIGRLWLVRTFDPALRQRLSQTIGGQLFIVKSEVLPESVHAQAASSQALWLIDKSRLAVAWLAADPTGQPIGYFRADFPIVQIHGQAVAARRMILITLSLSVGLVILVIMGIHILITGPVVRLLNRLQKLDTGEGYREALTRNLHGEPLVLARRLESAFEKLARMSKTDELTGLANRRRFEEVLELFYHQSRRYNRPMSLITMDVDFFKAVNDAAGHQAGDELLKVVAAAIEDACRKADLPARLGGDEFSILLPETLAVDARQVADRVLHAVSAKPIKAKSIEVNVTVSVGITDLNASEIDCPEAMQALADRALYTAKELGRNRVVMAHDLHGVGITEAQGGNQNVEVLVKKLAGVDGQFKDIFLQAVEEVAKVLEQRDPNMGDHARKVQRYAVLIAEEMELPERVIKRIEITAMLHDIGMLAMPDSVLLCPGPLDPQQLANMRRHPLLGVRIMERMEFLEQEIPTVRYHHERYDGKGYPEGIAGAAIPLTARILAVADTFDAMTSDRTFRTARTMTEAVGEIQKSAGIQFDPAVVESFVAVAARMGEEFMDLDAPGGESRWRQDTAPAPAPEPAPSEPS